MLTPGPAPADLSTWGTCLTFAQLSEMFPSTPARCPKHDTTVIMRLQQSSEKFRISLLEIQQWCKNHRSSTKLSNIYSFVSSVTLRYWLEDIYLYTPSVSKVCWLLRLSYSFVDDWFLRLSYAFFSPSSLLRTLSCLWPGAANSSRVETHGWVLNSGILVLWSEFHQSSRFSEVRTQASELI